MLAKRDHLRSNHLKSKNLVFFVHSIKMLKLSLNELKQIAKMRGIKGCKSMSEERLVSSINESEPVKESEKNFGDARTEKDQKRF